MTQCRNDFARKNNMISPIYQIHKIEVWETIGLPGVPIWCILSCERNLPICLLYALMYLLLLFH